MIGEISTQDLSLSPTLYQQTSSLFIFFMGLMALRFSHNHCFDTAKICCSKHLQNKRLCKILQNSKGEVVCQCYIINLNQTPRYKNNCEPRGKTKVDKSRINLIELTVQFGLLILGFRTQPENVWKNVLRTFIEHH